MFSPDSLLDLDRTEHSVIFENVTHAWEAIAKISTYLQFRLKPGIYGKLIGKPFISGAVYIGPGTIIEHGAMIKGPAWIGEGCQIRNGAYIRENVVVGNGVVLGNSCEFKNCLIFDEAQIPHFNYVGDSILGHKAHLGAGAILSNVRLDHAPISVAAPEGHINTGLKKFGAIVGDRAEIGCSSVISPGAIIGRDTIIYPGTSWRGVLPANSIGRVEPQRLKVIPRQTRD